MLAIANSTFELKGSVSSSNIFMYKICDRFHQIPQEFLDKAQQCMNTLQTTLHQEFVILSANARFYAPGTPNIEPVVPVRIKKSSRRYDLCSQFSGFSQCLGNMPPFIIFVEIPLCDGIPPHHDLIFSKKQVPEVRDFLGACFVQTADPLIWTPSAVPAQNSLSTLTPGIQTLAFQSPPLQPAVLLMATQQVPKATPTSTQQNSADSNGTDL